MYQANYFKKYDTEEEEAKRFSIFMKNKKFISEHNKKYEMGLESYELSVNEFSDMVMLNIIYTYVIQLMNFLEYQILNIFSDKK